MPTGSIRPTYESLYRWSVEQSAEFWRAFWEFSGIRASTPYRSVVTGPETHARRPLVRRRAAELRRESAVPRVLGDGRRFLQRARRPHRIELGRIAPPGRKPRPGAGVRRRRRGGSGRRVVAQPSRSGGGHACDGKYRGGLVVLFAGFRVNAVLDRFGQIGAKVLFATDGYFYNGKTIDCLPTVAEVVSRLGALKAVVVVGYVDPEPIWRWSRARSPFTS